MCNPILLGATAQLAGIGMQNRSAQKAQQSRSAYLGDERERQKGFEGAARKSQEAATGMFGRGNFDAGTMGTTQALGDRYAAMKSRAMPMKVPTQGGVPSIIANAVMTEQANAAAKAASQRAKLAKLNSFSDYLSSTLTPALSGSAMDTQTQGAFMQGSANVLGSELNAANAQAYNPLAQALQLGGQTAVGYGMMKPK